MKKVVLAIVGCLLFVIGWIVGAMGGSACERSRAANDCMVAKSELDQWSGQVGYGAKRYYKECRVQVECAPFEFADTREQRNKPEVAP